MTRTLVSFPDLAALSEAVAGRVADAAVEAVQERGRFSLVLSGGSTPLDLYERLARPPFMDRLPWDRIHLFWGDERFVPADHPDSNYRMASDAFVSRIPAPGAQVHRVRTDARTAGDAARAYENELRLFFGERPPAFDLVLLGMGADGHTASLFPGSLALEEEERWVLGAEVPPGVHPAVARVTMTLPTFAQARMVIFLVAGAEKRRIVDEIHADCEGAVEKYPAARVRTEGELLWMVA